MIYKEHLKYIPDKLRETLSLPNNYTQLELQPHSKIFIVGSGSSYSHGIFLRDMLENQVDNQIRVLNPYSFVRYHDISSDDVLIHITQEAKRNDNRCPMEYARKSNAHIILFTTKETELSKTADEVYWYAAEHAKLLVACESYISAYIPLLEWAYFQKHGKQMEIKWEYGIDRVSDCLKQKFTYDSSFKTFLYSGFGLSVALEGALKVNECLLEPAECYELKHFSHGKHFVTYDKPWTFNVLYDEIDKDLLDLYKKSIFEDHHTVNYFQGEHLGRVVILEWAALMLKFISDCMDAKGIQLEDIPIRDRIRLPHGFSY